jgi:hypothetical protein
MWKLQMRTVMRTKATREIFGFHGGITAQDGTPDGRDRLPEEVVVCPNTTTADANAKIVDKTLMMVI